MLKVTRPGSGVHPLFGLWRMVLLGPCHPRVPMSPVDAKLRSDQSARHWYARRRDRDRWRLLGTGSGQGLVGVGPGQGQAEPSPEVTIEIQWNTATLQILWDTQDSSI